MKNSWNLPVDGPQAAGLHIGWGLVVSVTTNMHRR